MKQITLYRTNEPDLKFFGETVAEAKSGEGDGFWKELYLFKTKAGNFVCHEIDGSNWSGCKNEYRTEICKEDKEIKKFFGYGDLAKELYLAAGLSEEEIIE